MSKSNIMAWKKEFNKLRFNNLFYQTQIITKGGRAGKKQINNR